MHYFINLSKCHALLIIYQYQKTFPIFCINFLSNIMVYPVVKNDHKHFIRIKRAN